MRAIKVKRLVYSKLGCSEVIYGGIEYDGNLSDKSILDSIHEIGKTEWRATNWIGPEDEWEDELWLLKPDPNNPKVKYPIYRIGVDTFYRYEKTWWDTFCDNIKRILRI
jgi:hypothetical protein